MPTRSPSRRTRFAGAVALLGVLASCSSSTVRAGVATSTVPVTTAATSAPTTTANTAATVTGTTESTTAGVATVPGTTSPAVPGSAATGGTTTTPGTCTPPVTTPVNAAQVAGSTRDWNITSFDGTVIRAHWFPVAGLATGATAPTILMGPGWGSGGDTNVDTVGVLGALNIASLQTAGYNVLTWDPRGFGASTGTVEIDSAAFEGRDVEQLTDWVATQPQARLDGSRDPRLGMVGASYGGGIQLVSSGIDCRIDAIVPVLAWNSLSTSLFKADTPKQGWATFLSVMGAGGRLDPTLARANESITTTSSVSPGDLSWFADRGPGDLVNNIRVPTLLIQGTVDTLFTLDEAVTNYEALTRNGVPVAMLWYCGGHGVCLTNPGDRTQVTKSAIAWLDRYVKLEKSAPEVPGFEIVDQDGAAFTAATYPDSARGRLAAAGSGTLSLTADGGSGPAKTDAIPGIVGRFVGLITPAKASNAVNVTIDVGSSSSLLVGAPEVTLDYSGTTPAGDRPTRVFAQLVDDATGLVIGNQITPIPVTLDGQRHTVSVPLELIAFTTHPGASVTLQLVASTVAYAAPRTGGTITFANINIRLPVATGMSPKSG